MRRWQPRILRDLAIQVLGLHTQFRRYEHFGRDFRWDPTFPQVIFIEPEYTDGPHHAPNDDHPPTPITNGQAFLHSIYRTLIRNPARWAKTLLIVTYDEHGGFFDHVPPVRVRTDPSADAVYEPFETTGVRVPSFLVSPFVERGTVFPDEVDHTAILGLLAERFTPGESYSDLVARRSPPLSPLSRALTRPAARDDLPNPPIVPDLTPPAAVRAVTPPRQADEVAPGAAANAVAFHEAARTMVRDYPLVVAQVLPELIAFVGPQAA
jgi:phospholipase C